MEDMKAISINQPWGWLVVNGLKDIENRSWYTKYRGTVLVHVGKKFDNHVNRPLLTEMAGMPMPNTFFQGGIIGQVDIIDCVNKSDSPWFSGKYGFVLENAVAFDEPKVCKGALGFFVPDYNSKYKAAK